MELFFTHESQLPPGVGFALFGPGHLLWLGGILLASIAAALAYRRLSPVRRRRAALAMGIIMVSLEGARELVLLLQGRYSVYTLPLHLCTMSLFLCLAHAIWRWDWLGQTVYTLCMPGAVAALLFPNWSMYPMWSFTNLVGFLFHGGVVIYGACGLAAGEICPHLRALWKPWVFLACVVPPVYLFDQRFHANYFFLNVPSPGSPLELLARFGNPGYLVAYGLLALAVMVLLDLPWTFRRNQ